MIGWRRAGRLGRHYATPCGRSPRLCGGGLEDSADMVRVSARVGLNGEPFARSNGVCIARMLVDRPR